jgi:WD40 repeat protein
MRRLFSHISPSSWLGLCLALISSEAYSAVSFLKEVAPLLQERCAECHRADKAKGGYRLHTYSALLKAGDSELAPVLQGKAEQSELLRRVVTHDEEERMPPKGDALPDAEVKLLRQWLAEGAKYDGMDTQQNWAELLPSSRAQTVSSSGKTLPVTALAASADGSLLATNGYGQVLLWDWRRGEQKGSINDMPERVLSLAWVPGTDWLAVAGGTPGKQGELWLAHGLNQQPARRLLSTSDTVNAVATSPDGKWLAAAGTDRHTRLYRLPEGKLKWDVEANSDWVLTLDFSPDGKLLASGSRDRTARLFDVQTGQVTATHDGHEAAVTSVCFFDKGRQVVSADAEGYLRRWTLDGRADKSTATRPGRQAVLALLSSQERTFVAFADKGLAEQDVKGKKVKRSFGKATRMNVITSFSQPPVVTSDGKKEPERMLVSGSHAGLLQVWRVADSSLIKEWPLVQK